MIEEKKVYIAFSTDILHTGHLSILQNAAALGKLTVGVLSDSAVASYKRYPLLPYAEREALFRNIKKVEQVVCQETLSYRGIIEQLHPDIIVHGDNWKTGFLRPLRDEVETLLSEYGGKLVEFPYSNAPELLDIEQRNRADAAIPDIRRGRLKRLLEMKGFVRILEAHSGLSGLIVENAAVYQNGIGRSFDGMWLSSLCDSTMKGKPDIELVDMTSRLQTINEIMDVTTKPIILDGDTGGLIEHFVHHVRTLESIGVSAIIIEDKIGLKRNSLLGTDVEQQQDDVENFCEKIAAGKRAMRTKEFMLIARIESLILEKGIDDAIARAFAYVKAGADGIMIHSRKKESDEIFEFVEKFREQDPVTPLVVVPTSFNAVTEEEFRRRGVNIVIYANQLIRSAFPAMMKTAECILENHRAKEVEDQLLPIKEIITLIPEKGYASPDIRGGV